MNKQQPNRLAVVPLPAAPMSRTYQDFDEWVAIADRLIVWSKAMDEAASHLDSGEGTAATAESIAGQYSDAEIVAMLQKWKAGERWYNRDDLYERLPDGSIGGAGRPIITEAVALLIGSFPNAGPHNGATYTRMLIEEIHATRPSVCALESACRHIRRTATFPPTAAEVLKVLNAESSRWSARWAITDDADGDPARWLMQRRDELKALIAPPSKQEER